ncbi:MAG TPA: hypothetical protein VLE97_10070 [Gaiellaceae bacterium]|nr:hypothetical protein [Gaiellaceae bacterium]
MLTARKGGRKIRAMVMKDPVDRCFGVVQCALDGCEAHMAIVEQGTRRDSGNVEDETPKAQVAWFLEHHECRAPGQRKGEKGSAS